jgi:hypothetical protein
MAPDEIWHVARSSPRKILSRAEVDVADTDRNNKPAVRRSADETAPAGREMREGGDDTRVPRQPAGQNRSDSERHRLRGDSDLDDAERDACFGTNRRDDEISES